LDPITTPTMTGLVMNTPRISNLYYRSLY